MPPNASSTALARSALPSPRAWKARPRRFGLDASMHGSRGRYTLVREIGRGGSAIVYLATDKRYGRQVAIKVLHERQTSATVRERFKKETETMARLRHPNILPIHDSGECDGRLFYITPFVAGGTVAGRIQNDGPLSWPEATRLITEVAEALTEVHAHDIVHLDIKPSNILLDHGHAVLADFGIARRVLWGRDASSSGSSPISGTPCYMSPEQSVAWKVDRRADVYALGCLLYEMLVGEPPFSGRNARAVCARQLMGPVPSARRAGADIPDRGEAALEQALAKDPRDRHATTEHFVSALL